jgi:methylphosphotriester-DNA--protein-cysteine methyltransferase
MRRAPTAGEAAELSFRSERSFRRHFRSVTGVSWREFLHRWRMRCARKTLAHGEVAIAWLAVVAWISIDGGLLTSVPPHLRVRAESFRPG